jgi:RNA polymerase sigma-70 factor (ECF subfamily)
VWNASDEALLAGFGTGEGDVAQAFVRRFRARVFGLALTMTRDRMVAQEVAQDTFLRAWRYAASYDPRRGSVTAWLLRIARNVALDHLRTSQRRLARVAVESAEAIDDIAGDADVLSPLGDLAVVAEGLRSLPANQRDALMAAAYYGMTAREISETWDIPLGTVKTRLRLALAKLRDQLAEVPS